MASENELQALHSFKFTTGLRGFHVYKDTVKWKPFKGQKITFKREMDNKYDRFAVAGRVLLPHKIGQITVGHIPREISRYTWYAILEGAKISAQVINEKYKPSPLVQGGLEIMILVEIEWNS